MGLLSDRNKINEVAEEFDSLSNRADSLVTSASQIITALNNLKSEVESDTDNFTQDEVDEIDALIIDFRNRLSNS